MTAHKDEIEVLKEEIGKLIMDSRPDWPAACSSVFATIDLLYQRGLLVIGGYVAVPIEPTEEMKKAGCLETCDEGGVNSHEIGKGLASEIYKAMIAAAKAQENQ